MNLINEIDSLIKKYRKNKDGEGEDEVDSDEDDLNGWCYRKF